MLTADTVLLKSCFAPGAIMHVVQNQKDSVIVRTSRATDFIANIGKQQPGSLDERSFDEIIYIDREIATRVGALYLSPQRSILTQRD